MSFGGSDTTSTTDSSSTTSNTYTDEQKSLLKEVASALSGVSGSTSSAVQSQLDAALSGEPTTAEKSWYRTGKENIAQSYKDLSTQTSEALAGKGTLGSGQSNKAMSALQTAQSKSEQNLNSELLTKQQEDLNTAISNALGLTSLSSSVSTTPTGSTTTGSSTTTGETSDSSGLATILGLVLSGALSTDTSGTSDETSGILNSGEGGGASYDTILSMLGLD